MIQTLLASKLKSQNQNEQNYQVQFFRLNQKEDAENFEQLIAQEHITISDVIENQLKELVKSYHPKQKLDSALMNQKVLEHLNGCQMYNYGVWVYYPWLQKVVHILDKEEFIQLRTNRNQYKISPEEKEKMAQARIGVLGLSVGQSVAMALTMERCYAELRIADFDTLDLSNLNRIRSGIQDLGLLKTVSTARQIAEIDPFLKVTCFHEGVNDQNIDDFLTKGGKLDILIDECDGFNVKILARQRAKTFKIPVLMETSDRCMLDIERFDLEPERPILHGLIEHLDLDYHRLSGLSMEQKVAYIMPILGIDTMSTKIKASMLEIDQSITTWPQLASDVIMGGAVTANVCRRMILENINFSGRFFLDLDELISHENEFFSLQKSSTTQHNTTEPRTENIELPHLTPQDYTLNLKKSQIENLIQAAILAPSGGNSQPWKFVYQNRILWCILDSERAKSFLDFRSSGSLVAIGAAIENIRLKAAEMGLESKIQYFPTQNQQIVATIEWYSLVQKTEYSTLVETINTRLTYRKNSPRKVIEPQIIEQIKKAGESVNPTSVKIITSPDLLRQLGQILGQVDYHLLTNPLGHQGFMSEIRWNDKEARETADGVDIATVDISKGELAAFEMAKDWKVIQKLIDWNGGQGFEKMAQKSVASASAMGLLTIEDYSFKNFVTLGTALQRLWLCANSLGIALQPMSPITFLFYRLFQGQGEGLSTQNVDAFKQLHQHFMEIFELKTSLKPGFLFRLLIPDGKVVNSYRRPLDEVFEFKS